MLGTPATFFDGASAFQHRVSVHLDLTHLVLTITGDSLPDGPLHWALDDLRSLQDHAERDALTLTLASLEDGDKGELPRLIIRDASLVEILRARCPDLNERAKLTKRQKGQLLRNIVVAIGAVLAMIFVILPGFARVAAEVIPLEREVAFGKSVRKQIEWLFSTTGTTLPTCRSEAADQAIALMLAQLTEGQDIPYDLDISVVDHELINAFALPGGQIVFFRGLIDKAETPDEVAAVLAHELGHVVHRDPIRESMRAAGSVGLLGLLFGDFTGGTMMAYLADSFLSASYSQQAEENADSYAHQVLERAEVSPAALGVFFARLRDEMGDVDGFMAHLSTHPRLADRIEAAGRAVDDDQTYRPILDDIEWQALKQICDLA